MKGGYLWSRIAAPCLSEYLSSCTDGLLRLRFASPVRLKLRDDLCVM
jgi:hypothetical protein